MELISKELIDLNQSSSSKQEVFKQAAAIAFQHGRITDQEKVVEGLFQREAQTSTGMIDGFAIPHTQNEAVKVPSIIILRNAADIEWETMDDSNVRFILAILIPKQAENNLHLKILSAISRKLMDERYRKFLLAAESRTEVVDLLEGIS